MHNPDFWEVGLEPTDLARYSNESGLWFETSEDYRRRRARDAQNQILMQAIMDLISRSLTQKQREALILYFIHHKTQEEVAQIMGISRRVVSQHLFGICREGRHVGGAINKIRKLCREHGIAQTASAAE